jgi:hypothetical protein
MNTARMVVLTCALAIGAGTSAGAQTPAHDAEAAVRRAAAQTAIGATVKLKTRDGRRMKAVLFAVYEDGIVVKPATRIPVPTERIPFNQLEALERDEGRLNYGRSLGIGAAVGGGVLLAMFLSFAGG